MDTFDVNSIKGGILMNAVNMKYSIDDFDIIEPNYKTIGSTRVNKEIIDLVPYIDDDGKEKYIDEVTRDEKIEEKKNKIYSMVHEIKKNNPLNQKSNNNHTFNNKSSNGSKIIYLDLEPVEGADSDTIICDYCDPAEVIYVDFDGLKKKEKRKSKLSLKRIACTVGIIFGLSAAISKAPHCNIYTSSNVSYQQDKDDSKANDNILKANKKEVRNKTSKKSKNNYIQLKDTSLYYTSTGEGPSVKTSSLSCDSYQVNHIAILSSDNEVMDVIKIDKSKKVNPKKIEKQCKSIYGNDINIKINVDGIIDGKKVYNQAGWASIKKVVNRVKTYTKRI